MDKPKPRTGPTTWKKGQSANPGGRSPRVGPNGESLTELCRVKTVGCVDVLYDIVLGVSNDAKDRITAAFGLLDRGWGRPKESVDIEANVTSNTPIINLTVTRGTNEDGGA